MRVLGAWELGIYKGKDKRATSVIKKPGVVRLKVSLTPVLVSSDDDGGKDQQPLAEETVNYESVYVWSLMTRRQPACRPTAAWALFPVWWLTNIHPGSRCHEDGIQSPCLRYERARQFRARGTKQKQSLCASGSREVHLVYVPWWRRNHFWESMLYFDNLLFRS